MLGDSLSPVESAGGRLGPAVDWIVSGVTAQRGITMMNSAPGLESSAT